MAAFTTGYLRGCYIAVAGVLQWDLIDVLFEDFLKKRRKVAFLQAVNSEAHKHGAGGAGSGETKAGSSLDNY